MVQQRESLFFRIFSSKIFFVLVLIFSIYLAMNLYKDLNQRKKVKNEINNLTSQIDSVSKQNDELKNLISYFGTDDYIESFSREKLGLKKPGEKILVLPEENSNIEVDTTKTSEKSDFLKNLRAWWDYFFNFNEK